MSLDKKLGAPVTIIAIFITFLERSVIVSNMSMLFFLFGFLVHDFELLSVSISTFLLHFAHIQNVHLCVTSYQLFFEQLGQWWLGVFIDLSFIRAIKSSI